MTISILLSWPKYQSYEPKLKFYFILLYVPQPFGYRPRHRWRFFFRYQWIRSCKTMNTPPPPALWRRRFERKHSRKPWHYTIPESGSFIIFMFDICHRGQPLSQPITYVWQLSGGGLCPPNCDYICSACVFGCVLVYSFFLHTPLPPKTFPWSLECEKQFLPVEPGLCCACVHILTVGLTKIWFPHTVYVFRMTNYG